MTPELWKTIRSWLDIVASIASILTVLTFVLNYWAVAVPFIPTILKYGWPLIAVYAAFRIIQFGRSFYKRFTGVELQVLGNAVDVDTRLDEQAKAHQDSVDELARLLQQEIHNRKQLETQLDKKLKFLEEILRQEIKQREKVGYQLQELKVSVATNRKATLAELVSPSGVLQEAAEKKPTATRSLADMTPGQALALGAPPLKRSM